VLDHIVVISDDSVESGGAAAVALASVRLFRQRGLAVTVISGDGKPNAELVRIGCSVECLGGRHLLDGARAAAALRGLYDGRMRQQLAAWIARNDTPGTVYHLHNWHKVLSPSVFAALRPVAARLVMSAHDYFLACPNGGYFHFPGQRICELTPGSMRCVVASCDRRHYGHKLWRLVRHQVRRALVDLAATDATVLAVHEGMVPYLERAGIGGGNIRVLRNPVTPWRAERVAAERNRDVFFVGRLEEDKGLDLLVRAASAADIRLRVVGDGPLAAVIARQSPDVQLLGWQPRERIAELAVEARLVAAPTRWRETFGLVMFEALMSGIPVVASHFSLASGEVVRHGFGVACDPHDTEGLAKILRSLGRDDALIEQMSRRAFEEGRGLAPDREQWCDALLALYREKLAAAPAPARRAA